MKKTLLSILIFCLISCAPKSVVECEDESDECERHKILNPLEWR